MSDETTREGRGPAGPDVLVLRRAGGDRSPPASPEEVARAIEARGLVAEVSPSWPGPGARADVVVCWREAAGPSGAADCLGAVREGRFGAAVVLEAPPTDRTEDGGLRTEEGRAVAVLPLQSSVLSPASLSGDALPSGPRVPVCRQGAAENGSRYVLRGSSDWGADAVAALAEAAASLALERKERRSRAAEGPSETADGLVAVASHDLRTPVSTLRLVHDLLVAGPGPRRESRGDYDELLEIMGRNLDRMEAFVNGILEAWRLRPGDSEPRPEPVNLNAVVEDVVASLFPAAIKKDIALDLAADDGAGLVRAQKTPVGQVVANLVGNALKYTPRGGTVRVQTRRVEGGAELEVEDTGPGISAEDQVRLFRKFERGRARATGGEPGAGLGLYICRQIMDLYGGRIGVASGPGGGSRFTAFWPAWV